jgi:hypothetical protein
VTSATANRYARSSGASCSASASASGVGGDASEVELPEVISPQALGRIWASSMGLSFCVPAEVDVVSVKAEWGRYDESEQETDDGKKVRSWSRKPITHETGKGSIRDVRLDAEPSYKRCGGRDVAARCPDAERADALSVHLLPEAQERDGGLDVLGAMERILKQALLALALPLG